ncbi:MAG: YdcH family protein [Myxococcota bacterium]
MRKSRPSDPNRQLEWLERKHATLKNQVHELESRVSLTSGEQLERQRLKKEKLRTKDELERVRDSVIPA